MRREVHGDRLAQVFQILAGARATQRGAPGAEVFELLEAARLCRHLEHLPVLGHAHAEVPVATRLPSGVAAVRASSVDTADFWRSVSASKCRGSEQAVNAAAGSTVA